ncbi:YopX family protein [Bacillus cereus]|nr:YopX family protein [Bacillus cereus]
MREKKFRYTFKHIATGNVERKIYTLSQLETRNVSELSPCFNSEFGYELIGRDEFTGLKDKLGNDIYEEDLIERNDGQIRRVYWHDKFADWVATDFGDSLYLFADESEVVGTTRGTMKIAYIINEDGTSNENFIVELKDYKKGVIIENYGEKFEVVSDNTSTVSILRISEENK